MAALTGTFINVPGTPAAPQFAEVVYRGHTVDSDGETRPSINVYHFRRRSSAIAPSAVALLARVAAQIEGGISAAISDAYVADATSCQLIDDPTTGKTIGVNGIVGAIGGDRMPSGNGAVVVRYRGMATGRSFQGSKHYSPIAESDTTLDELNAGARTRWAVVRDDALGLIDMTDGDGNVWDLIVLSQLLSDRTVNPSIFTGVYVNTTQLNKSVGTMRRRREKAGGIV